MQRTVPVKIHRIGFFSGHEHQSCCMSPFAKTAPLPQIERIVAVSSSNIELHVIKCQISIDLESESGFVRANIGRKLCLNTPVFFLPLLRPCSKRTSEKKKDQPLFHCCGFAIIVPKITNFQPFILPFMQSRHLLCTNHCLLTRKVYI
jgi:hypothetical protein